MKAEFVLGLAGLTMFCATTAYSAQPRSVQHASGGPKSFAGCLYVRAGVGYTAFERYSTVGAGMSTSYIAKKPKASPIYSLGVGYKFTNNIRSDLNFYYGKIRYNQSDTDQNLKQTSKTMGLMLNGYYDFKLNETFTPYLTAGAGFGRNKSGDLNQTVLVTGDLTKWSGKNKTDFVWNAGCGLGVNLTKHISIDLGYRYISFGKIAIRDINPVGKGRGTQRIKGQQGLASLLYNFG